MKRTIIFTGSISTIVSLGSMAIAVISAWNRIPAGAVVSGIVSPIFGMIAGASVLAYMIEERRKGE